MDSNQVLCLGYIFSNFTNTGLKLWLSWQLNKCLTLHTTQLTVSFSFWKHYVTIITILKVSLFCHIHLKNVLCPNLQPYYICVSDKGVLMIKIFPTYQQHNVLARQFKIRLHQIGWILQHLQNREELGCGLIGRYALLWICKTY